MKTKKMPSKKTATKGQKPRRLAPEPCSGVSRMRDEAQKYLDYARQNLERAAAKMETEEWGGAIDAMRAARNDLQSFEFPAMGLFKITAFQYRQNASDQATASTKFNQHDR